MKKLITLLLVLTGMVSTASAEGSTYLHVDRGVWADANPNIFVYYETSSGSSGWRKITNVNNGDYSTMIPVGTTKIELYRCNPNKNYDPTVSGTTIIWNTSDQGNDGILWNNIKSISISSAYAQPYIVLESWGENGSTNYKVGDWVCYLPGSRHITAGYEEWNSASETNKLTGVATNNHTFTYTVTGKALKAGTYSYKYVVGNNWIGNGEANFTVTISSDGVYDLAFSFDQFTNTQSCTATKTSDATVEYKYYVKEAAGNAITGKNWDENLMTVSGSTATLTAQNALTGNTTYSFGIVEEVYQDGTKKNTYEASETWSLTTPSASTTYDVTFTFNIPSDFEFSSSNVSATATLVDGAYYFVLSAVADNWYIGEKLNFKHDTYSGTLSNWAGKWFAIAPASALSETGISDWSKVIRPSEKNGDYNFDINFENYNSRSTTTGLTGYVWYVGAGNDGDIDFSYDTNDGINQWSAAPSFTREISSEGYATFSYGANAAIETPNVTAFYAASITNDKQVLLKPFADAIPANTGAMLKLEYGGDVKFVPATTATSPIEDNLFVPTTSETEIPQESGYYYYVLAASDGIGFYSVSRSGVKSGAGKAYLRTQEDLNPDPNTDARVSWVFEDEATSISTLKSENGENSVFDLQGRRVSQPVKGLYIVNGKKVIK